MTTRSASLTVAALTAVALLGLAPQFSRAIEPITIPNYMLDKWEFAGVAPWNLIELGRRAGVPSMVSNLVGVTRGLSGPHYLDLAQAIRLQGVANDIANGRMIGGNPAAAAIRAQSSPVFGNPALMPRPPAPRLTPQQQQGLLLAQRQAQQQLLQRQQALLRQQQLQQIYNAQLQARLRQLGPQGMPRR